MKGKTIFTKTRMKATTTKTRLRVNSAGKKSGKVIKREHPCTKPNEKLVALPTVTSVCDWTNTIITKLNFLASCNSIDLRALIAR